MLEPEYTYFRFVLGGLFDSAEEFCGDLSQILRGLLWAVLGAGSSRIWGTLLWAVVGAGSNRI